MKKALKIIIFVICLGASSSGLLVALNNYTSPLIAKNEELKLKSSVLEALNIEYESVKVEQVFDNNVKVVSKDGLIFYRYQDKAIAFQFSGAGLWGPIKGIVSIDSSLNKISNIKILKQEETPGLGGRITEESFLNQFKGKSFRPSLIFVKGPAAKDNEIDSITGATGTSKALEDLLNKTISEYVAVLER
ncbi:MAG: hypothetical protein COV72_03050 [Candidatus Omnitrophica bacterium CG11_big_fil_rev_8_21_14_0_20_42_13]|uniref:FMN-binding domain-containing protein n=1 Tax=Candidatus Ghiorseimicrobium undicola TaxID=1974746 RepID=A0A2H0M0I7_9BACT|nr:MAG: hypothetical protein COV72_03050 [Candidatus Omnitrophica bacterium CG11_big_fil_rev_8_21_14_0_20_42_13]